MQETEYRIQETGDGYEAASSFAKATKDTSAEVETAKD